MRAVHCRPVGRGANGGRKRGRAAVCFLIAWGIAGASLRAAGSAAGGGAPAAGAAGAASGSPAETGGQEMILFQDLPSVFGASKYEQKSTEAPASVSIVTAEEIEKYGYRTLSEVLRSLRGVFTTDDRNYTYIGVRGFNRPGDYDTRVLLLLDGHRLNDNVYDQAAIGTESFIDVGMIDRVELIRGPSSSLYGTNAFFAVINVITKSGRQMKGGELEAEGGSYDTGRGRVAYGAKLPNGGDVLGTASYYDMGGQTLFYPEYDDPSTHNGRTDADGDKAGHFFAKASSGNWLVEGGASSRQKIIPTGSFGTDFADPRNRTTDSRAFLSVKYDRAIGSASRLIGSAAYDAYRYSGRYVYSGAVSKDYGYGGWWTGEIQSITSLRDRHKVIYGAEYRYNSQQDQGYYQSSPYVPYLSDNRHSSIWALYAQDEIRAGDHLLFNLGVRHDGYDTFGGTTNPRLAVILTPQDSTALKFLYGTAFRAPNAYELYYQDGVSQNANPDLQPETIRTAEIVLEQGIGGGLKSVLSIYQYRIRNLITLEPDPIDPVNFSTFENIDRVRAEGIELELEGRLGRHLDGRVSYAYQNSLDEATGDRLTNSPRHLAKLNLSAPVWKDKLSAGLEVLYLSGRDTLIGDHTGGYAVTNLNLWSRQWKRGPSISLGVFNLFDARYGDPASEEHIEQVIRQNGRNYRLQLHYEF
jgi:outer membrane receptor protein involved in Fe transport